jgi:hypothetical protein
MEKMNLRNRASLKKNFSKGRLLSESDFSELIDSSVNKIDDGFSKDDKNGLQLAPSKESEKVMSIFNHITDPNPLWSFNLEKNNDARLFKIQGAESKKYLSFHQNGKIGINTSTPTSDLEVRGVTGMKGRFGTYAWGEKDSDGAWHTILEEEAGIGIYEVVAVIYGANGTPQHAALYALVTKVFNKSKIKKVRTQKGWFFNSIRIRWKKNNTGNGFGDHSWLLQLRTVRKYQKQENGKFPKIQFHVSRMDRPNLPA